jgi:hypothetical protein
LRFTKPAGTVAGPRPQELLPEQAPMPVPVVEGLPGRR